MLNTKKRETLEIIELPKSFSKVEVEIIPDSKNSCYQKRFRCFLYSLTVKEYVILRYFS